MISRGGAVEVVIGQRAHLLDPGTVLRRLGKLECLPDGPLRGLVSVSEIVLRRLQLICACRQTKITDPDHHAADRRLCFDRPSSESLLNGCGFVGVSHRRIAIHLREDHPADQKDGEQRSNRKLRSDPKILDPFHRIPQYAMVAAMAC